MDIPHVTRAEYRSGYTIHLVFNDGLEADVDFADWLDGPIFEPVRDHRVFRQFTVDLGTITWANGADIAPETLYERAKTAAA